MLPQPVTVPRPVTLTLTQPVALLSHFLRETFFLDFFFAFLDSEWLNWKKTFFETFSIFGLKMTKCRPSDHFLREKNFFPFFLLLFWTQNGSIRKKKISKKVEKWPKKVEKMAKKCPCPPQNGQFSKIFVKNDPRFRFPTQKLI